MAKYAIDISLLTKEILINGQVATAEVTIAIMAHMGSIVDKDTGSDSVSYYVKGIGELVFTPEKNMTQDQINDLLRNGTLNSYSINKKEEEK